MSKLAMLVCVGLLAGSSVASGQDTVPTEAVGTQSGDVAVAEIELATVGSGAPEVFVWFGLDEQVVEPSELAARRALVERLRADMEPGTGRFHVLVQAGPKGAAEVAFDQDFPDMALPSEDGAGVEKAPVFQRQDTRALASYLTREAASGGGPVLMVRAATDGTDSAPGAPVPRGFERFARRGLAMGLARFPWASSATGVDDAALDTMLEAAEAALFVQRDSVRLALTAGELIQLGGDLFQVDLSLAGLGALPDPAALDPRRTYARSRLALGLTSVLAPPPEGAPEIEAPGDEGTTSEPAIRLAAEAVELALQSTPNAPFERLSKRAANGERFVLGRAQGPRTLRLVVRIPQGVERVELTLDSSRFGAAPVSLVRPVSKGPVPEGDSSDGVAPR